MKDPELSYANQGKTAVVNAVIAVDDYDSSEKDTDFIKIVVWGRRAEALAENIRQGEQIGVHGKIKTRSYTNKEEKKIYVTEVVANEVTYCSCKKDSSKIEEHNDEDNESYAGTPFE